MPPPYGSGGTIIMLLNNFNQVSCQSVLCELYVGLKITCTEYACIVTRWIDGASNGKTKYRLISSVIFRISKRRAQTAYVRCFSSSSTRTLLGNGLISWPVAVSAPCLVDSCKPPGQLSADRPSRHRAAFRPVTSCFSGYLRPLVSWTSNPSAHLPFCPQGQTSTSWHLLAITLQIIYTHACKHPCTHKSCSRFTWKTI